MVVIVVDLVQILLEHQRVLLQHACYVFQSYTELGSVKRGQTSSQTNCFLGYGKKCWLSLAYIQMPCWLWSLLNPSDVYLGH
jgi:hypothetical protein